MLNQYRDWFAYKKSKFQNVTISVFEEPWKVVDFDTKWTVLKELKEKPSDWTRDIKSDPNTFFFYPFDNLVGKF